MSLIPRRISSRTRFRTPIDAPRPRHAVHARLGVSLAVPRGSLTGLLGPNGCGKTTLLKLLAGVLRPDAGTVTLERPRARRHCRAASPRGRSPSCRRKRIRRSTTPCSRWC